LPGRESSERVVWELGRDSGAGTEARGVGSDGAEDGEDHADVVRARTAVVSRVPTMPKGARYETPTISGANDAGKDSKRDGRLWSARCGPCLCGSGADINGTKGESGGHGLGHPALPEISIQT